jgi:hypothetical protein
MTEQSNLPEPDELGWEITTYKGRTYISPDGKWILIEVDAMLGPNVRWGWYLYGPGTSGKYICDQSMDPVEIVSEWWQTDDFAAEVARRAGKLIKWPPPGGRAGLYETD